MRVATLDGAIDALEALGQGPESEGAVVQLMPDSPVRRAALEVEAHVAADGWDQPARLFALVPTVDLIAREPELAAQVEASPGGFTSIEQELPADGRELEDLLTEIGWPETVIGCAVVVERLMLPPEAEDALPDDPDAMVAAAAQHPDRREVRLVAAVDPWGSGSFRGSRSHRRRRRRRAARGPRPGAGPGGPAPPTLEP